MKWLFTTLATCSVSLCVLAASGCSNDARNSSANQDADRAAERQETDNIEPSSFVNANWVLEAEPGAVRLHQRVDPVTGRTIELTEEQSAVSNDDGQSALERREAREHQESRGRQTTYGDPTGKVQAVR